MIAEYDRDKRISKFQSKLFALEHENKQLRNTAIWFCNLVISGDIRKYTNEVFEEFDKTLRYRKG